MSDYDDGWSEADLSEAYGEPTMPHMPADGEATALHDPVTEEGEPTIVHEEPVSEGKLPRSTVAIIAGVAAFVCIVAVVVGVLFFSPLQVASNVACERLTPDSPSFAAESGLVLSLGAGEQVRVCPDVISTDEFLQGETDQAFAGARSNLSPLLVLKSPVYVLGAEEAVGAAVPIPDGLDPRLADLYSWNAEASEWVFIPSTIEGDMLQADAVSGNAAVFETQRVTPLLATVLEPEQTPDDDLLATMNMVMATGLRLREDGAIDGQLTGGWELDAGYAVLPLVRANGDAGNAVLSDPNLMALHVDDLRALLASNNLTGVALDYRGISDAATFNAFLETLSAGLEADGRTLVVLVPQPEQAAGSWDTGSYDWQTIGVLADAVAIRTSSVPAEFAIDGEAYQTLAYGTRLVPRQQLFFMTTATSVGIAPDEVMEVSFQEAITPLGRVRVVNGDAESVETGQQLAFGLGGNFEDFTPDQTTGAYRYMTQINGEETEAWVITASTVRARLDLAQAYHVGGMVVSNLLVEGADPGLLTALNEFKTSSISSVPSQLLLQWSVTGDDGDVLSQTTSIDAPFVWEVADAGRYEVTADLIGSDSIRRGSVSIEVGAGEEPEAAAAPATETVPDTSNNDDAPPQEPPTTDEPTLTPPPPSTGGGSDGGGFELGGQVPNAMVNIAEMQSAGMSWVKFQIKWSPGLDPGIAGVYVDAGRSSGFKVLLSIPGPLYPSSIDFAAYTEFLRQVAAYQPDAIEVWNEMNLNREWPSGQIDPTSYVNNMLAPGFNAIKSVSPNTMVIIGALAPTGADDGVNVWSDQRYVQGLAAAGAANYANCIGVHHNSGTTSPYVRSGRPEGDHYSWYFQPTLEVYYFGLGGALPVCITELGYLSPEGYGELPANFSWAAQNTVAQHAQWLGEAATVSRSLGWVRMMIVFNVGFTTWTGDDPQAGYSIVRPDGSCPACAALAGS